MVCSCLPPYIGPSLAGTFGGNSSSAYLFMSVLNTFLSYQCEITEMCSRIQPKHAPEAEYDFIVVGGGSCGSVVAGRLAEVSKWTTLVVEAGNDEPPGSEVPSMTMNFFNNPLMDWMYKVQPEPWACLSAPNQQCTWTRGKVLGGCSTINGLMYLRGVPRDYDYWASQGNSGWSYKDLLPFFKKSENNSDVGTLVDRNYHGTDGPLNVIRSTYQPEVVPDILKGAEELGYPVVNDLSGKETIGFTVTQSTIKNGARDSAARAYLRPHRNTLNLDIMVNSTVTKILMTTNQKGKKVANEIEFFYKNRYYKVKARRGIIIAGGVVNSPQLLLLSGIGPKDVLDKVNITQTHDLPGVGKNLHNHVAYDLQYIMKNRRALVDLQWSDVLEYFLNNDGKMSSFGANAAVGRVQSDNVGDFPDLQIAFVGYVANGAYTGQIGALLYPNDPKARRAFAISAVLLQPDSRGYLTLKSKNPFEAPLIYPHYLKEPQDVARVVSAIRIAQKLANTTAFGRKYGLELQNDQLDLCRRSHKFNSDPFWECVIRNFTNPKAHAVGSCKMGNASDPLAVVDQHLQVYGIENLYVMDASIMPKIPSANPYATCIVIAEKGVQDLKDKWLGPALGGTS